MIYRIEWRKKEWEHSDPWTPLEQELWDQEHHANERLKYWQSLSISRLIEFRVVGVKE